MTSSGRHHTQHGHRHGENCGHMAIRHQDHIDYLHDGHLHHMHGDQVDEHVIEVSADTPDRCKPNASCTGHTHGPGCGHPAVPHGNHTDYLVDGHLHHMHNDHCDDHGEIQLS